MMLRISRGALAAALLALTAIIAPARAAPLPVVASFSVLGDLVRQIGGERVTVVTLVGPDGDTHVFEPSPDDARALAAARLVVVNGLGLEGWISRLIHSSGYRGPVVVASDGVTPRTGDTHAPGVDPHAHGVDTHAPGVDTHAHGVDPHAWQNVANAGLYVRNLGEALASADPEHGAEYRANADAYRARLEGLDREVRDAFARLPRERRKIITSHDAFGYFGDAYGLTLLAPVGLGTESEPSARAVGALIDQIRREGIHAIFIENMSDPRLIQQIAKESGAKIGGRLFSDALSAADGPASTYLDMVRYNTNIIIHSLAVSP